MDTIFYFVIAEQIIVNAALTAAIIVFGWSVKRVLESSVEPELRVNIGGTRASSEITVTNVSACDVEDVTVDLTHVGLSASHQPYCSTLFSNAWRSMRPRACVSFDMPLTGVGISSNENGTVPSEISVKWSLTRRADGRIFSAAYTLKLVERESGDLSLAAIDRAAFAESERSASQARPARTQKKLTSRTSVATNGQVTQAYAGECIG
jgi:hypothetical protein